MKLNGIIGITMGVIFLTAFLISFILYPEIGEKILYGKHPPTKIEERLTYSEIITSGNYKCIESATDKAHGDLEKFVDEFNDCNASGLMAP